MRNLDVQLGISENMGRSQAGVLLSPQRLPEEMLFPPTRRRRLLAAAIDLSCYVSFALLCASAPLWGVWEESLRVVLHIVSAVGVVAVFHLLVTLTLLGLYGQSIGKAIMDICIVKTDGSPASLVRVLLLRNVFCLIFFLLLIFLVSGDLSRDGLLQFSIWAALFFLLDSCMVLREDGRALHDIIAGTKVIEV